MALILRPIVMSESEEAKGLGIWQRTAKILRLELFSAPSRLLSLVARVTVAQGKLQNSKHRAPSIKSAGSVSAIYHAAIRLSIIDYETYSLTA